MQNYYKETLNKIKELIDHNDFNKARILIIDELKMPYIPKDFEQELINLLDNIGYVDNKINHNLSDEEINAYLFKEEHYQLLAVNELDKHNLRDYLELCQKYLCSDGLLEAKVLLIDSLIRQEINEEIKMEHQDMEYYFIPKYLLTINETSGYKSGLLLIEDVLFQDPSKLKLAYNIFLKENMLRLPLNLDSNEGLYLAIDVIEYIYQAFDDIEALEYFISIKNDLLNNKKYYIN